MTPWLSDPDVDIYVGDALDVLRTMPAGSVDCVVTSPPYWGLRDYGTEGQLGLEATPDLYVAAMVAVFREVRRVLADHGTLWCNLGDTYNAGTDAKRKAPTTAVDVGGWQTAEIDGGARIGFPGLKTKDLCGMPWRLAFALQADGWWLRSEITWCKKNCMPESVTDRPTKATEKVFLLAKRATYYYDAEAVREPHAHDGRKVTTVVGGNGSIQHRDGERWPGAGRNMRDWWEIATQPYPEAHFATFPEELARRCILAGCPEWVCGSCGKARERLVEREFVKLANRLPSRKARQDGADMADINSHEAMGFNRTETVGWSDCGHHAYKPGRVLDPFLGSGTTAHVARKHGRRCVGIELNEAYAELAARRLQQLSLLADGGAA